jgi:hypothetical protein
MQMVQRQQERDNAMRSSQMQPLKYNTGGTYGGIGIGDQKKKAKPGIGAEPVFGVDPVLPQQPSMASWQEDNAEIQKMIDAGGFGYGVSRQLRNLIDRENTLRNNTRLNDAQKQEGLDRILRNKEALLGTSTLDPSTANAVREQRQAPDAFNKWAQENPKDYFEAWNNTRTRLMEQNQNGAVPSDQDILNALRAPITALQPKAATPQAQLPAAAADDDNPYNSVLDELQKERRIGERRYGGPVYPGQTVTVGEEGPELMQVGYDGVAQVAPNPATMARMQEDMYPNSFSQETILPQGGSQQNKMLFGPGSDPRIMAGLGGGWQHYLTPDQQVLMQDVFLPALRSARQQQGTPVQPGSQANPPASRNGDWTALGPALAPAHPDYKPDPTPTNRTDEHGYVIMSDGSKVDPRDSLAMSTGGKATQSVVRLDHPDGSLKDQRRSANVINEYTDATSKGNVTGKTGDISRATPSYYNQVWGRENVLAQPAAPAQNGPQSSPAAPSAEIQYNPNISYEQSADALRKEIAKRPDGQKVLDAIDAHEKEYDQWKRNEANRLYNQRPVARDTPSIGKPRVWTNNKGKTFKGELRGVRHFNDGDPAVSDVAVIRTKDGKTYVVPLQDLSEKDRAIVMQTPDYASETRMEGENQGTYQEMFNPDTPEGQRMREPRPRQTPTPEQLESGRKGKYGVGGVSGGILSQRGGARQEAPPAYEQPVLQDGQIATSPGLASQPGIRVTGPKGERLPPAGANMDPRDTSPYTQILAELGPTEGAKFTAALKKKGRWLFRDADSEELLKKVGKLKKRGVDGYGKPYASPSDESQFQPPARPAWWDGWRDPNAQERRLTPEELASRGYMVNQAGQVVPIPRDSQGRPVMQPPSAPQQQAPQSTPQGAFEPSTEIAIKAAEVIRNPASTQADINSAIQTLSIAGATIEYIANIEKERESNKSSKSANRKAPKLPSGVKPVPGFENPIVIDYGQKPAPPNTTQPQPTVPKQGSPTIDAIASEIAPDQSQTTPSRKDLLEQKKPIGLPKDQPAVQNEFWNEWWSTNSAPYQSSKDQNNSMVELTAADGNRKMKGTVELISHPMKEIGGQRVITFKREDGAVVNFYSGQLSEEDQSKLMAMAEMAPRGIPANSNEGDISQEPKPKKQKYETKPQNKDGINRGGKKSFASPSQRRTS